MKRFIKIIVMFCVLAGAAFLGEGSAKAASIGSTLSSPESGWTRIVNSSSYFSYQGTDWHYGGGRDYYTINTNSRLKFDFYGTKLRFYSYACAGHAQDLIINIDGVDHHVRQALDSNGRFDTLDFEITGLPLVNHVVSVHTTGGYLSFSDIDIDSNGHMLPYVNGSFLINMGNKVIEDTEYVDFKNEVKAYISPNFALTFSSSDERVIKVDENGIASVVGSGNATVTASLNGTDTKVVWNVKAIKTVFKLKAEKNMLNVGDDVNMDLKISNVKDVKSAGVVISYVPSKLKFVGFNSLSDIKVVKCSDKNGQLAIEVKCINGKTISSIEVLGKLKFKALDAGNTDACITYGRVSTSTNKVYSPVSGELGQESLNIA